MTQRWVSQRPRAFQRTRTSRRRISGSRVARSTRSTRKRATRLAAPLQLPRIISSDLVGAHKAAKNIPAPRGDRGEKSPELVVIHLAAWTDQAVLKELSAIVTNNTSLSSRSLGLERR
jgi:hypothetical protein